MELGSSSGTLHAAIGLLLPFQRQLRQNMLQHTVVESFVHTLITLARTTAILNTLCHGFSQSLVVYAGILPYNKPTLSLIVLPSRCTHMLSKILLLSCCYCNIQKLLNLSRWYNHQIQIWQLNHMIKNNIGNVEWNHIQKHQTVKESSKLRNIQHVLFHNL